MLNDRLQAAHSVRSTLLPAEEASEDTLERLLELGLAMCRARRDAALPLDTAQRAFDEVMAGITHANHARSCLINAHRDFAGEISRILPGVPAHMVGDISPLKGLETTPLHAVA